MYMLIFITFVVLFGFSSSANEKRQASSELANRNRLGEALNFVLGPVKRAHILKGTNVDHKAFTSFRRRCYGHLAWYSTFYLFCFEVYHDVTGYLYLLVYT